MENLTSGDQFNLKWNNHMANFIQVFIEHQNNEALVDVTLSCEGQYIKAHKLILSACSDYFQSIFQIHNNITQPFILLNGIRFQDLKSILHFMYHGEVKVLDKDLPYVLALGQSLQIKGLSAVKLKDVPDESSQTQSTNNNMEIETKSLNQLLPTEVPTNYSTSKINDLSQNAQSKCNNFSPSPGLNLNRSPQPSVTSTHTTNDVISDAHPLKKRKKETDNADVQNIQRDSPQPSVTPETKVPKPTNAFMIFANDWRMKLTAEHPEKSTKEISIKLGNMWKALVPEMKKVYYDAAKKAEEEHKLMYPNYSPVGTDVWKKKAIDSSENNSPLDPLMLVEVDEEAILLSEDD